MFGVHRAIFPSHALEFARQPFGLAPVADQAIGHQRGGQREHYPEHADHPRQVFKERPAQRGVGCDDQGEGAVAETNQL